MQSDSKRKLELVILLLIGLAPAEFNWLYLSRLANRPALFWLVDVSRFAVLPAAIFCWGLYRGLFRPADLGLHRRVFGRSSVGLFAAAMMVVPFLMVWLDRLNLEFSNRIVVPRPAFSYYQMIPPPGPDTGWLRFLVISYMAIGAGVVEEFYYLGLVRHICGRGRLRSACFVVVSAALFAPPHCFGGVAKVVYVECFALEAALIYLITGNLWPLILGHIMIDFR